MNSRRDDFVLYGYGAFGCMSLFAQAPKPLPRVTTEATINGKKVSIAYGRPSINGPALAGHDMFSLAPVGTVWDWGPTRATVQLNPPARSKLAGKVLEPGKYSFVGKHVSADQWFISFHRRPEDNGKPLWGQPDQEKASISRYAVDSRKATDSSEFLDIKLCRRQGKAGSPSISAMSPSLVRSA